MSKREPPASPTNFGINTFAAMPRQCGYCGMVHGFRCPSVHAVEYYPDGTVKRVEFVKSQPIAGLDPEILRKGPVA
jgi:hypothetical protein